LARIFRVIRAHPDQRLDLTLSEGEHPAAVGFRQLEVAARGLQIEATQLLAQQERIERRRLIEYRQGAQVAAGVVDRDPKRLRERFLELALADENVARAETEIVRLDRHHDLRRRAARRRELIGLAAPETMLDDDRSVQRRMLEHRRGRILGQMTLEFPDRPQIEHA
jgi:hypothetical protein